MTEWQISNIDISHFIRSFHKQLTELHMFIFRSFVAACCIYVRHAQEPWFSVEQKTDSLHNGVCALKLKDDRLHAIKTRCLKGIALRDMLYSLVPTVIRSVYGHYDWHNKADRGTSSIILIRLGYDMNTRSIRPCAIRWDLLQTYFRWRDLWRYHYPFRYDNIRSSKIV